MDPLPDLLLGYVPPAEVTLPPDDEQDGGGETAHAPRTRDAPGTVPPAPRADPGRRRRLRTPQETVSAASSTTKLVCSDVSSVPLNESVTLLPATPDSANDRCT